MESNEDIAKYDLLVKKRTVSLTQLTGLPVLS
ncbi:MAG: hypothetical protein PWQ75_1237 [Methanolobus sp.]|jgi:hypothetical protein|nr:hypothetical protein [Methanolobus sp.]MDK2831485.1 hypothetical protein [Methanolobus sp.]